MYLFESRLSFHLAMSLPSFGLVCRGFPPETEDSSSRKRKRHQNEEVFLNIWQKTILSHTFLPRRKNKERSPFKVASLTIQKRWVGGCRRADSCCWRANVTSQLSWSGHALIHMSGFKAAPRAFLFWHWQAGESVDEFKTRHVAHGAAATLSHFQEKLKLASCLNLSRCFGWTSDPANWRPPVAVVVTTVV